MLISRDYHFQHCSGVSELLCAEAGAVRYGQGSPGNSASSALCGFEANHNGSGSSHGHFSHGFPEGHCRSPAFWAFQAKPTRSSFYNSGYCLLYTIKWDRVSYGGSWQQRGQSACHQQARKANLIRQKAAWQSFHPRRPVPPFLSPFPLIRSIFFLQNQFRILKGQAIWLLKFPNSNPICFARRHQPSQTSPASLASAQGVPA